MYRQMKKKEEYQQATEKLEEFVTNSLRKHKVETEARIQQYKEQHRQLVMQLLKVNHLLMQRLWFV